MITKRVVRAWRRWSPRCRGPAAKTRTVLALAAWLAPLRAHAERAIDLWGDAACPSRAAVLAALHEVDGELVERSGSLRVDLVSDGDRVRVVAGTLSRDLTETACDARAKSAAVFVTLVLDAPPTPEPAPPPRPTPPPVPRRKHRWAVTIDVAAVFAAGQPERAYTGGGAVRVYAGTPWLGALVGIEGLAPVTLHGTLEDVRLARVPVDVGLRLRWTTHRVELALDGELVAGPLFTRGTLAQGTSTVRDELGVRVAARVAYHASPRFSPFLVFQADVDATRYALTSAGTEITHTPRAWLGFALGGAVDLP